MMINAQKLDRIMIDLGHRENILGTGYIREGVELYNRGFTRMTKEVYPALAKAANSTPSRVERAMRHSITSAWGRGDIELQSRLFGFTIDPARGAPTVGEYLARVARVCNED